MKHNNVQMNITKDLSFYVMKLCNYKNIYIHHGAII